MRVIVEVVVFVVLFFREIEREFENDSEISLIRRCILSNNWLECKDVSYLVVKDEFGVIGKIVFRGRRIVIFKFLREYVV